MSEHLPVHCTKLTFLVRSQNCGGEKKILAASRACPSVRTKQLGYYWTDIHKIQYLKGFLLENLPNKSKFH
jgi:hypothetical protein